MLFSRLEKLCGEIVNYNIELLFVNDGSKDNTFEIIQKYATQNSNVSYINLSRNFGKEIAMIAGIDHFSSDALVIIDADLQDPPELIPEMIKYWEQGFDDVYAKRNSRSGESFIKKITSSLYYKVLAKSTQIPIQRDTGDFRLLDAKCVNALKSMREECRNMKALFSWIGYKKKEITYDRDQRAAGTTHFNYFKLIKLAIDGITNFTTSPLKVSTIFGFFVSFFAFVYALIIVIQAIFYGINVSGYASTMVAILLLGGIQLIAVGILGEYLARVFLETKKRPLYFTDEVKIAVFESQK